MEDNNKRRCRKSKLIPREYLDSDDENIAVMQNEIEQTIAMMTSSTILKKLSRRTEEPLKFSIKVEVEELDELNTKQDEETDCNIKIDPVVPSPPSVPRSPVRTNIPTTKIRIPKCRTKVIQRPNQEEFKARIEIVMGLSDSKQSNDSIEIDQSKVNSNDPRQPIDPRLSNDPKQNNFTPTLIIKEEPGIEKEQDDIIKQKYDKNNSYNSMNMDNINRTVVKQEIVEHVIEVCEFTEVKTEVDDERADQHNVQEYDGSEADERFNQFYCSKIYSCKKCLFKGIHRDYKQHLKSECRHRTLYSCTKCHTSYQTMNKYLNHFRRHEYEAKTCPKCLKRLPTLPQLVAHVYQHIKSNFVGVHLIRGRSSNKCFQCRECRVRVRCGDFFGHWESHVRLREPGEVQGVPEVGGDKPFLKELIALLQGEASTEPRVRRCVACDKSFSRRNDLKRHAIEHLLRDASQQLQQQQCLRCQLCGLGFSKVDVYKRHMRDHGSLPLYKCETCDKTFSDSSNFSKHKKVHNLRVLICDVCKKKFTCKAFLIRHMQLHERQQPIGCDCCGRLFHSASQYRKHRSGRYRFRCSRCGVTFDSLKHKWDHMWLEHKERKYLADCPICQQPFRKFVDVKAHIRAEHDPLYVYRPQLLKVDQGEVIVCD